MPVPRKKRTSARTPVDSLPAHEKPLSRARPAAGVSPAARGANLLQLRRARGQIDGIERMILDDRYCADIIFQITAARASLLVVSKALLEAHLKMLHKRASTNGGAVADELYQELVDIVGKMAR